MRLGYQQSNHLLLDMVMEEAYVKTFHLPLEVMYYCINQ